jgi:2-dehydro-3-deoxygluconokinase
MARAMSDLRIVCFGEILLRLSAPHGELPLQSPRLDACIGGAEANVAVALASLGHDVAMASVLPDQALGRAARDALRRHGVDTRAIGWRPGRLGLYFLAPGAVLRPSEILYDREGSAFAAADPACYDWASLLDGAAWLHVSGVTPAVGPLAARAVLDAVRMAARANVRVSFDGNYRASLWERQGSDGASVLRELLSHAELAFADQRDIALVLGRSGLAHPGGRDEAAQAAFEAFPRLQALAATIRTQHGTCRHSLSATLHTREHRHATGTLELEGIVDRIGTGDAFAAGMLHAVIRGWAPADALDFGLAAAAYKHSIVGDFMAAGERDIRGKGLDVRR